MRLIPSGLVCLALINVARAAGAAASADKGDEKWIADFQRFAAQKNIQAESSYSLPSGEEAQVSFSGLLRDLPAPPAWPHLRQAVVEAAGARLSAEQQIDRQRLQAGAWLLAYLAGDQAAIQSEITRSIGTEGAAKQQQKDYALNHLLESLSGPSAEEQSAKKLVEDFEAQLVMLEPVDEAAIKKLLGGEENFVRLKQMIATGRELERRFGEIYKEYEKNKDEAGAQAKAEALQKEYADKNQAEWDSLATYLKEPLVRRYLNVMARDPVNNLSEGSYIPDLYLPNLIGAVGRERAVELLRRAIGVGARLGLNGTVKDATVQLARELMLADIDRVKVPSWGLVNDAHAAELFEVFHKKFPEMKPEDYSYRSACGYYVASLIVQGRPADAVKFVGGFAASDDREQKVELPYEVINDLEHNHADALWDFLRGELAANPGAGEWDRFNRLSALLDRGEELKVLIKTLAADGSLVGMNRLKAQSLQADAEMATGEINAARDRLRGLVAMPAATENERREQEEIIRRLLELADLQGDQAGFTSLLAIAETSLKKDREKKVEPGLIATQELTQTLNELGHFAESARIGRAALELISEFEKTATAKKLPEGEAAELPGYLFKDILGEQLRAEVELGHWKEAHAWLQENPWWEAKDATGLLNRILSSRRPLGYYVARVVQAEGDRALARRILEAQLVKTPAVDAVYEAYLASAGQAALPLLQKLEAADRYEERPLIWRARLQMDAKQWDAAIGTLQQAITIDPSDGDEGRGDRMRVYAFMSLAMAAKGNAEKATFFANVVKAIRLSETADRWYEIGVYAQAITLYREALGFFQDAYCIQSRLAIRLTEAGKIDEAAEHYRRAFELMPDSFGRVESHCFGCEHAFAGKKPQGVAEEVFARMLQARPDKPQLHYLFGYLREEQERLPEAAEHYRRAVQLDPLYLNAWNRLAGLDRKLKFSTAQRDDLLIKLHELDPRHEHASPDLKEVSNLPRLWQVLKETEVVLDTLPTPSDLWELKASALHLAQAKDHHTHAWEIDRRKNDFAAVLLEHEFIGALQVYLASLNQPAEEAGEPTSEVKTN